MGDRHQILGRVESEKTIDPWCNRHLRGRRQQQRAAVRIAACDGRGTDQACGTTSIFNDDRLAERPACLVAQQSCQHVDGTPGRERHHKRDRLLGEVRRACRRRRQYASKQYVTTVQHARSRHRQDDLARCLP